MSPIRFQNVPIQFQGLETGVDPKQAVAGQLLQLSNGVFPHIGAISKRWGYDALSTSIIGTSTSITKSVAISSFLNELLLFDGLLSYAYLPANNGWISKGHAVSVITDNNQVIRNNSAQSSPDFATLNGVDFVAWEDTRGGIRYSVIDTDTQTFIVSDQQLGSNAAYAKPKLIAFPEANLVSLFFTDGSGNILNAAFNPSQPTLTLVPNNVISDGYIGSKYDVCHGLTSPTTASLFLTYINSSNGICAVAFNTNLNPIFSTSFASTDNALGAINITTNNTLAPTRSTLMISVVKTTNTKVATYSVDSLALTLNTSAFTYINAGAVIDAIAVIQSNAAGTMALYVELEGTLAQYHRIETTTFTTSFVVSAQTVFKRGVGIASKPFYLNSQVYINTLFSTPLQATYFTIDSLGNTVAKISVGLAGALIGSQNGMVPECPLTDTAIVRFANLKKGAIFSQNNNVFTNLGVNLTTLDFEHSSQFLSTSINGNLYMVGGVPQTYDGSIFVEQNFNYYPEQDGYAITTSGGNLSQGQYQYVFTYEWIDNNGNKQYSAPSVALTVTTANAVSLVTLTVPTLKLTSKSNVQIGIYRTQVNLTNFNKITTLSNSTTVDSLTFADTLADTVIASNEILYTTGGQLNTVAPPACSLITQYGDRIFVAGLEDKNQLSYTQPRNLNTPMQFCAELTIEVDPEGGDITALATFNEKLIIFKEQAIFYIVGQGPTMNGQSSDYGTPVNIASDVGCINANAIVVGPTFIMFRSQKGIYMLDGSLTPTYVGKQVEAYNDLTITSSTLYPTSQVVIFTTAEGTALVYNYFLQRWSTFSNHYAVDSDVFAGAPSGLVPYVYANPNGKVYQANLDKFTDGSTPYKLSLQTSYLSFAGIQGFQRVRKLFILGDYKSSHKLNVSIAYDWTTTPSAFTTIDATAALGLTAYGVGPYGAGPYGGVGGIYQFRLDLAQQKCQTLSITIEDSQSTNFGEGYQISGISLEVGAKTGGAKIQGYANK